MEMTRELVTCGGVRVIGGAVQAHTPSTKNYAVEIPTWSILRDLQHHMTTSDKCNGLVDRGRTPAR